MHHGYACLATLIPSVVILTVVSFTNQELSDLILNQLIVVHSIQLVPAICIRASFVADVKLFGFD